DDPDDPDREDATHGCKYYSGWNSSAMVKTFLAEDWKGSLEPGKAADVTVLDGTLTALDPHDLPDTPVAMTVFDGRVVHAAEGV
ncbi:amidohydrolase family protein, partial [Actinomadura sp. NPDC048032]|uniref:amidohydrolase family protein n=1 Tax=Actinomadura sp. NPDC048032 TaxID=3155747 RepID=UPI0033D319F1